MTEIATTRIFPFLRYEDAPAAFEWLATAFGFEKQMIVPGPQGTISHAQLRYGGSLVMIGTAQDDFMNLKSPTALGGATQGIYVHVNDVDAHHDRAKAAGAEIIMPLEETPYGSREYMARDPEGHLWSFGNYAPEIGGAAIA
jgi:uncharacterized glyoxalase superfamily protein PhnB